MREYFYQLITGQKKGIIAFILKFILWILSLIYGVLLRLVLWLYEIGILRKHKLTARVISVGNITWGGTGKTPLVKMLAEYLKEQGRKPAVIIRGYKSKPQAQGYQKIGDEAFFLSQGSSIPVIAGKDRVAGGIQAIKDFSVDTLILDDGFQHWRLKRDLEIVAIDCTNPFDSGFLIPRGILREPLSGLKRAEIFFLTKTDLEADSISEIINRLKAVNPTALIVESMHRPVGFYSLLQREEIIPPDKLKGKRIALACSIGNPQAFEKTIRSLGLIPELKFFFMDHHHYQPQDIDKIIDGCRQANLNTLITTQKDAVRLKDYSEKLSSLQVLVLQIEISITRGRDDFFNRLSRLYPA